MINRESRFIGRKLYKSEVLLVAHTDKKQKKIWPLPYGTKRLVLTLSLHLLLFQKIAERSRALLPPAQTDKRKVSWYGGWKSTLCFTVILKRGGWWDGISLLDCILTRAPLKLCLVSSTLLYYIGLHSSRPTLMHCWMNFFKIWI